MKCLLLLLCTAITVYAAYAPNDCTSMTNVPATLQTMSSLKFNEEFYDSSSYYYDVTKTQTEIVFTLTKECLLRFNARTNVAALRLTVYSGTNVVISSNEADNTLESHLAGVLTGGEYKLVIKSVGFVDADALKQCPELVLTSAVVPTSTLTTRYNNAVHCPATDTTPVVFDTTKYTAPVHYVFNSDATYYVHRGTSYNVTKAYTFELEQPSTPYMFSLKITIDTPFSVGGSLGMMLVHGVKTAMTPSECAASDSCIFGYHVSPNEFGLSTSLSAGKFTLLLYSAAGDAAAVVSKYPCIPFGMHLTLTSGSDSATSDLCTALRVPKTFNAPGLLGADGAMHYRQEVQLQLGTTSHVISFNVSGESVIRGYVSEHGVDIDMALYEKGGVVPIAASASQSGDEGLVYVLAAGEYELRLYYFGFQDFDLTSCDTYILEVSIAPARALTCGTETKPDLTGMPTSLSSNGYYSFGQEDETFMHVYPSVYVDKEEIVSVNITLTKTTNLLIVTYNDFSVGDVSVALVSGSNYIKSVHTGDRNVLHATVAAGTYKFLVYAGRVQSTIQHMDALPACANYRLKVEIGTPSVVPLQCYLSIPLPRSLDKIGWTNTAGSMHFSAVFSLPNVTAYRHEESTNFTVSQESMVRFYVPEHHIDIDLMLYRAGDYIPIDSAINFSQEETILYHAQPGQYVLKVVYFHTDTEKNDHVCLSYTMQGAITPVTKIPSTCDDVLPAADYLKHPDANGVIDVTGTFKFGQTAQARVIPLTFQLTKPYSVFKASISSEFGYGHTVLYLRRNSTNLGAPTTMSLSDTSYNTDKLGPIMLSPGTYTLSVEEPKIAAENAIQGCVEFKLTVRIAPYTSSDAQAQSCNAHTLPPTLNSPGYTLLRQDVLLSRTVSVAVVNKKFESRFVNFTVTAKSIFRAFVPKHKDVDIDVILYSRNGSELIYVDGCFGFDDEAMDAVLESGQFALKFNYVLQYDSEYDQPQDNVCYSHNVMMMLAPVSYLTAIPSVSSACTISEPKTLVTDGAWQYQSYHWNISRSSISIPLNTDGRVFVQWNMHVPFETNSLKCYLDGTTKTVDNPDPLYVLVPCTVSTSSVYITAVIPKGNYTLYIVPQIEPSKQHVLPATFLCYPYDLYYRINSTSQDIDPCPSYVVLPRDLYNVSGGSVGHGGPQAADGTIRLFMEQVPVPHGIRPYQTQVIKMMAPVNELMRVYIFTGPELDIDLQLFRGPNHTAENFIDMSYASDDEESMLVALNKSTIAYELVLMYWKLPQDYHGTCPSFSLEISIKPQTVVDDLLKCPAEMPVHPLPQQSMDAIAAPSHFVTFAGDYVLSSTQQQIYKTPEGKFAYDIQLTGGFNTTLFASVQYDFLVNDFDLVLYDTDAAGNKMNVLARSWTDPNPDRRAKYNFGNAIFKTQLPVGKYILTLQEDLLDKEEITGAYCHYFYMYAMLSSNEAAIQPRILEITPASATNVDYNDDMLIQIHFSEAVKGCRNLADTAPAKPMVFLTSALSLQMLPLVADFWNDCSLMLVLFDRRLFSAGVRYQLIIDMTYFHPASSPNTTFINDAGLHIYEMTSCQCNDHGTCVSAANLTCICEHPYTGSRCTKCKDGYHMVGNTCEQNVLCKATSCSGHGTCSDITGVPVCTCDVGYASDSACSACSTGFHMENGSCIADTNRKTSICDALILPSSLDVIGFMKYGQAFHLLDKYYIDIDLGYHYTTFSINQPSMIRVFVAPHWVDVDIFIVRFITEHDIEIIASAVQYQGSQEIINTIMNTTGEYQLRFHYYNWDFARTPDCETFDLELEIAPYSGYIEYSNTYCPSADRLPQMPSPGGGAYPAIPATGYTFKPAASSLPFAVLTNGRREFYSFSFSIPEVATQNAIIHAEIGYRFLTGEMEVVIEGGNNKTACLNSSKCLFGYNLHNRNILHSKLSPGNYTMWLMQPVPINPLHSKCSEFEFEMEITFVKQEDSIYNCAAERLPMRLNNEEYIHDDRLHLAEDFYLDASKKTHLIYFTLGTPSIFRCTVPVHDVDIDLLLYDRSDMTFPINSSINFYDDELLYMNLPSSHYALEIRYYYNNFEPAACTTFHMELAIEPQAGNALVDLGCPADNKPRPPTWLAITGDTSDAPNISTKVSYGVPSSLSVYPKSFYYIPRSDDAFQKQIIVANLTFNLKVQALLWSRIQYEFISSDMDIVLSSPNYNRSIIGNHDYNSDYMVEVLPAGTYNLMIILVAPVSHYHRMACVPYHFEIEITPTSNILDLVQTVRCLRETRAVPYTLNTIDMIDQHIHIESQNWAIPTRWDHDSAVHTIKFSVTVPSIFSMYVAVNKVDIDLLLYNHGPDRSYQSLVDHSQSYESDEALHDLLIPGVSYEVDIVFMKFDVVVAPCDVFNMEIAIEPINDLDPMIPCVDGKDMWPPTPQFTLPNGVYEYDSENSNIDLYIQPVLATTKLHEIPLTLTKSCDIHAEVSYSFPTHDIGVVLRSQSSRSDAYGFNRRNRHVLNARDVPAGNYTLIIYTPHVPIADTMTCAHYNFYVRIEQATLNVGGVTTHIPSVPASLNRVPYMWRDPSHRGIANGTLTAEVAYCTHLHGQFLINTVTRGDDMLFNVTVPCIARIYTSPHLLDIDLKLLRYNTSSGKWDVAGKSMNYSGEELIYVDIPAGDYKVSLTYYASADSHWYFPTAEDHVSFDFEFAVCAKNVLNLIQAQYPTISHFDPVAAIVPDAAGYYKASYKMAGQSSHEAHIYYGPTHPLAHSTFTVVSDSVINVRSTSDYLLGDVLINLRQTSPVNRTIPNANYYDGAGIYSMIRAGTYDFIVYQPQALLPYVTVPLLYTLEVSVFPVSQDTHHVCAFDTYYLPRDLNSVNGGSAQFGGPISDGFLYLYGQHFLMHHSQSLSFSFNDSVIVRTYYELPHPRTGMNMYISDNRTARVMPYIDTTAGIQRTSIYLRNKDNGVNRAEFSYTLPWDDPCWDYVLNIHSARLNDVISTVVCPANATGASPVLPKNKAVVDADGFYYELLRSFIRRSSMSVQQPWNHTININVPARSEISLIFSYYGLANEFDVLLLEDVWDSSRNSSNQIMKARADIVPESKQGGYVSDISVRQSVSGTLLQGNYTIKITSSPLSRALVNFTDAQRDLCYPFVYELRVTPYDVSVPYVRQVSPPGSEYAAPDRDLVVTVSFSEEIYDASGARVAMESDDRIRKAFYLTDDQSDLLPRVAHKSDLVGLVYDLIFEFNTSVPKTYTLHLKPGRLFDRDHNALQLSNAHVYKTMDTTCWGHGHRGVNSGVCTCDAGYAHVDCSVCAPGYYVRSGVETKHDTPLVCVPVGSEVCNPNSCNGHGNCSDITGKVLCSCFTQYDGEKCARCHDGFINYPECTAVKKCVYDCHSGTCDTTTGMCVCPPGLAPPDCLNPVKEEEETTPFQSAVRVVGVSLAIVVMGSAIGVFIYQENRRRRGPQNRGRYRRIALNTEEPTLAEEPDDVEDVHPVNQIQQDDNDHLVTEPQSDDVTE